MEKTPQHLQQYQIFVPTSESELFKVSLSNGGKVEAFAVLGEGKDADLYALTSKGSTVRLSTSGLASSTAKRFIKDMDYAPAAPGNPAAKALAASLDGKQGVSLLGRTAEANLAKLEAGPRVAYIPFDPKKGVHEYETGPAHSGFSISLASDSLGGPLRQVQFSAEWTALPPEARRSDLAPLDGFIVPADKAASMPRVSEYGGPAEHAAFALVSSGLASFSEAEGSSRNLTIDSGTAEFPRGVINLVLADGARLDVGVSAGDELKVAVSKDGYSAPHIVREAPVLNVKEAAELIAGGVVAHERQVFQEQQRTAEAAAVKLAAPDYRAAAGKFYANISTFNHNADPKRWDDLAKAMECLDKGKPDTELKVGSGERAVRITAEALLDHYSEVLAQRGLDGDGVYMAKQTLQEVREAKHEQATSLGNKGFAVVGDIKEEPYGGGFSATICRTNEAGKPVKGQVFEMKGLGESEAELKRVAVRVQELIKAEPGRDIREAGLRALYQVRVEIRKEEKQAEQTAGKEGKGGGLGF